MGPTSVHAAPQGRHPLHDAATERPRKSFRHPHTPAAPLPPPSGRPAPGRCPLLGPRPLDPFPPERAVPLWPAKRRREVGGIDPDPKRGGRSRISRKYGLLRPRPHPLPSRGKLPLWEDARLLFRSLARPSRWALVARTPRSGPSLSAPQDLACPGSLLRLNTRHLSLSGRARPRL